VCRNLRASQGCAHFHAVSRCRRGLAKGKLLLVRSWLTIAGGLGNPGARKMPENIGV
jgi:hypothetical protein